MAKARPVPGIKPKRSLRENAQRVISVRLDEFMSWREALVDETLVSELHDMRIAAKRLRYALEMFDLCLLEPKMLLKDLSGIQDDLGDIHDFDVLAVLLRERLAALDAAKERNAVLVMGDDVATRAERSRQIRQVLSADARNPRRIGLISLVGDVVGARHRRFIKFQERYGGTRLDSFAARIRAAQQSQSQGANSHIDDSERKDTAIRTVPAASELSE